MAMEYCIKRLNVGYLMQFLLLSSLFMFMYLKKKMFWSFECIEECISAAVTAARGLKKIFRYVILKKIVCLKNVTILDQYYVLCCLVILEDSACLTIKKRSINIFKLKKSTLLFFWTTLMYRSEILFICSVTYKFAGSS
jgi:hypothetical protein